jgi:3-oxoacyl-[acyl-carrier-protein] synthase-1
VTGQEDGLSVVRLGLCTPLGLTTRTTQVEMAAGTVRFFLTDVPGARGEVTRASRLSLLDPDAPRSERIVQLASTALQECLEEVPFEKSQRLPLLLALPSPGSGASIEEARLLEALERTATPHLLHMEASGLHREGRAGFFMALAQAEVAIRTGRARRVLVGAVDSRCDPVSLRLLAGQQRLLSSTVRDGILPGEGAGFVLLTRTSPAGRQELPCLGRILAVALAKEPRPMTRREPSGAEGLTEAFHHLRNHPIAGTRRVVRVLSCQTGETYWGHEFNRAYLRNAALMPEPLLVELVAETLGDAGASSGVIQVGQALHLLRDIEAERGLAPRALVYGCSDDGPLGACIVERAT